MGRRRLQALVLASSFCASGRAWALEDNGAPIDTSEYTLDIHEGPNLANARLVALAGSYNVLAPGVQGFPFNPASVVAREPWSVTWFDWEVDAGITLPASITSFDFDNNGDEAFANEAALFGMLGGRLQLGDFGVSVRLAPPASWLPDAAPEGVTPDEDGNYVSEGYFLPRTITLPTEIHAGVAFQLFRPLNFRYVNPRDEDSEAERVQTEIEAERSRREEERARRVREAKEQGADDETLDALQDSLDRGEEEYDEQASDRLDRAKDADRARRLVPYKTMPREKVLVSAAVKVTTITTNGVGVESFLRQVVERSGETVAVSPRLGVEAEAVPAYLVVRGGSYIEPLSHGQLPRPRHRWVRRLYPHRVERLRPLRRGHDVPRRGRHRRGVEVLRVGRLGRYLAMTGSAARLPPGPSGAIEVGSLPHMERDVPQYPVPYVVGLECSCVAKRSIPGI